MFWRKNRTNEGYIDLGMVPCPRTHADVELDVCFGCGFARQIEQRGRTPFVRCDPPREPAAKRAHGRQ